MNTPPPQPDPEELRQARLTAFALDQLDPQERAEVEEELLASSADRREVQELRQLAEHLRETARREAAGDGSDGSRSAALRAAVESHLKHVEETAMDSPNDVRPSQPTGGARRSWMVWVAAACVLLAAVPLTLPIFTRAREASRMARNQAPAKASAQAVTGPASSRAAKAEAAREDEIILSETNKPPVDPSEVTAESRLAPSQPAEPDVGQQQEATYYDVSSIGEGHRGGQGDGRAKDAPRGMASGGLGFNLKADAPQPTKPASGEEGETVAGSGYGFRGRARRDTLLERFGGQKSHGAAGPDAGPSSQSTPAPRPAPKPQSSSALPLVEQSGQSMPEDYDGLASHGPRTEDLALGVQNDREGRKEAESLERLPERKPEGTEQYEQPPENPFVPVARQPKSTFSIDVDTASYANVRRFLREGRLPPGEVVRIEEMVNYFRYDYPEPAVGVPFSASMEAAECPWNGDHRLVRIGLKARDVPRDQRGPSNLVFLLDVSGSMDEPNKLPLVKEAMELLVDQLGEDDRVAIVTYASGVNLALESTNGTHKDAIRRVIDGLAAGGSTNGAGGIQMAYDEARQNFRRGGTNRVILATDGDFNVGISDDDELVRFIQERAKSGVLLSVLGVGTGNLKDAKMEKLADKGNGTYAYLDSLREARRVLVEQMSGTLVTVAKDVKVQVEFNPAEVAAYRLVGYENRMLAARDFRDDRKDAGEIGAGHTVTAFYEVIPAGAAKASAEPPLKYQRAPQRDLTDAARSGEMLTLRLRFKKPDADRSEELEFPLRDGGKRFGQASRDFRFAAAVAMFGMLLRGSEHPGNTTLAAVDEIASAARGEDPHGERAELVDLIRGARQLSGR